MAAAPHRPVSTMAIMTRCATCKGTGTKTDGTTCPDCKGAGMKIKQGT